MNFFQRYNRIMKITFLSVILVAFGLFILQAQIQYQNIMRQATERFRETAQSMDYFLENATNHINTCKIAAESFFFDPEEAAKQPDIFTCFEDNPTSGFFHMDNLKEPFNKSCYANLTGKGSYRNRPEEYYQEIKMVFSLLPIFRSAIANLPFVPWVYYTSRNEFIAIYPWTPSSDFHYTDSALGQEFYILGTPFKNPTRKIFFTSAYVDMAGKGLMVTCGAPVYRGDEFLGTVAIDATLDSLNKFVSNFPYRPATLFLINERNEILAHPTLAHSSDTSVKSIQAAFPSQMPVQIDKLFQANPLTIQHVGKYLFTYQPLKKAPWRLVLLAPRKAVFLNQMLGSALVLIVLMLGLTFMLLVTNRATREEFIKPAEKLILHIENASRDAGMPIPKVPVTWRPWFETISRIFGENDRLLGELKQNNERLDSLVAKRTSEVRERNIELEKAVARLKEMQEQIILQEKMASLGVLTAGIAHEIKNPLNFVNNFSELSVELCGELKESLQSARKKFDAKEWDAIEDIIANMEQNVQKIQEHGKRADSIVRGMLLHSRGKTGERQMTDFNALVTEYVNLAYHGMRAQDASFNVKIITKLDPAIGQISIVPQDLSRAILNLVNNGCDSAYEKKKSATGDAFNPVLTVQTRDLGDCVELRIHDNGRGIPANIKEKIFSPFFTTKPTGKGTGLGLSIVYDVVVHEHCGQVRVEAEEGEFAEFIVTIPKDAKSCPVRMPSGRTRKADEKV